MDVRRVVTGHDEHGSSVFVTDETVSPDVPIMLPGAEFHQLWGGDATAAFPDDGAKPSYRTYFPPIGGFRFGMFSIPPATTARDQEPEGAAAIEDAERKLPGLLQYMDPTDPGMHTTDTIDFEVVLEGTVVLELDGGAQVTLGPGDTVVQNGTRHRWTNPGATTARLAVFMCGAEHSVVRHGQ
jgi:mannose-6-phosphate isomerase-like protein (cupin superfamily)